MAKTVLNDQQLVAATRQGDDRAFEELYERYRPQIQAFARRLTHDPDRADDLAQEVFISALRRLRATDRAIDFRPWIYEIARNACIDEYRRTRRQVEVSIDRDSIDGWLGHLSGGPSPEVAVESKQQLADLQGAFRGLSQRHHRIIVARELEGKSYRQIGDELGMSQVVVESTLFRARRRLGEEFQELSSGRRCERVRGIIGTADGRRLGLRDRRAVTQHIEHCRPCRREALAAGWGLQLRPSNRLQKVAAAIFPVPLLRLLRRSGAAVSRGLHQSAASPLSGCTGSVVLGSGRAVATAATVLAAAVGGGLITQATQAPARGVSRSEIRPAQSGRDGAGTRVAGGLSRGQTARQVSALGAASRSVPARSRSATVKPRVAAASPPATQIAAAPAANPAQRVATPAIAQPAVSTESGGSGRALKLSGTSPGVPVVHSGAGPRAPKLPPPVVKLPGAGTSAGTLGTVSLVVSKATGVKLPSAG